VLGWRLSGAAKLIKAVASRRALLWRLLDGDLYGDAFKQAELACVGWAASSSALMAKWHLHDYPAWSAQERGATTLVRYQCYVLQDLIVAGRPAWQRRVAQHASQVPYDVFQVGFRATLAAH
jgi:hypothetical protein